MFAICVENLIRFGRKENLILRLKKTPFYHFKNWRKEGSKFNIEYGEPSLQSSNTFRKNPQMLFICSLFTIRFLSQRQRQRKNHEGHSKSPCGPLSAFQTNLKVIQGHAKATTIAF